MMSLVAALDFGAQAVVPPPADAGGQVQKSLPAWSDLTNELRPISSPFVRSPVPFQQRTRHFLLHRQFPPSSVSDRRELRHAAMQKEQPASIRR